MFRFLFTLLLLVGLSFGGKSDSLRIVALSAKVDSLSQVLKDAQLSASYAEKNLEITKELGKNANGNLWLQFSIFVGAVVTIFGIASASLGYFIYKRTKDEQKDIAKNVTSILIEQFKSNFEKSDKQLLEVDSRLQTLDRNYHYFAGQTEAALDKLQKAGVEIQNKLTQISKFEERLKTVEFDMAYNEYRSRIDEIDLAFSAKQYANAMSTILMGIATQSRNGPIPTFFKSYFARLLRVLTVSKVIRHETKETLEKIMESFTEEDRESVNNLLSTLKVRPPTGGKTNLADLWEDDVI